MNETSATSGAPASAVTPSVPALLAPFASRLPDLARPAMDLWTDAASRAAAIQTDFVVGLVQAGLEPARRALADPADALATMQRAWLQPQQAVAPAWRWAAGMMGVAMQAGASMATLMTSAALASTGTAAGAAGAAAGSTRDAAQAAGRAGAAARDASVDAAALATRTLVGAAEAALRDGPDTALVRAVAEEPAERAAARGGRGRAARPEGARPTRAGPARGAGSRRAERPAAARGGRRGAAGKAGAAKGRGTGRGRR